MIETQGTKCFLKEGGKYMYILVTCAWEFDICHNVVEKLMNDFVTKSFSYRFKMSYK